MMLLRLAADLGLAIGSGEQHAVVARDREASRLQPYVMEAATVCNGGCDRM